MPSKQTLQLLGLLIPGALLLAASRRRGRFAVPAAAALATGGLAALASAVIAHRRHRAIDRRIDERVKHSFPASDPPAL